MRVPLTFILLLCWSLTGISSRAQETNLLKHELQFRKELKTNPKSALLWFNLGQILLAQGRCPEALNAYQKVIQLQSSLEPAARIYRVECFLELGRPRRALAELKMVDLPELPPNLRLRGRELEHDLGGLIHPDWGLEQLKVELLAGVDSNAYLLPQTLSPEKNPFWRLSTQLLGPQWYMDLTLEEYNLDVEQSPRQKTSRAVTTSVTKPYDLEFDGIAVTLFPQLSLDFLEGQHFLTRPSLEAVTHGQNLPWRLAYRLESRMGVVSEARYSTSVLNTLFFSYSLEPRGNHQWIPYLHLVDRQGESLALDNEETLPLAYRGFGPGLRWKMQLGNNLFHNFQFRVLRKSYKEKALPAKLKRLDQELNVSYRIHWQWRSRLGLFVQYDKVINSSNIGEGILLEDRNYRQWLISGGLQWTGPI